jgi:ribosome-binding ATPase YchF (GTP1/OBG family)
MVAGPSLMQPWVFRFTRILRSTPGVRLCTIQWRMKIALFGISEIKLGKHNLKDPRFDQADKLVEADKKTYAQVDVIGEDQLLDADVILALEENKADLILKDLEFVETRLGRDPQPAERTVLEKMKTLLESEKFVFNSGLSPEDLQAVAAHSFFTNKPITVAARDQLQEPDALLLRAFADAEYICFLTVGGKENRAWPIRRGTTAWEAAGSIHTDMQKGFIRAEIIGFDDFIAAGGETEAKRAGKQRLETKQYVMQDHDLTNFRFNK